MEDPKDLIINTLKERSCLKQDVYQKTLNAFTTMKGVIEEVIDEIISEFGKTDDRVKFYYKDRGVHEAEMKIAGDILIFNMHTNVFKIEESNSVWQSSYIRDDESNAYVGVINIYNFLADSIKYHRLQDSGYLIGRIFVNKEDHFMVQGKRQLGYLYNDFIHAKLDRDTLKNIVQSSILYTLNFDLLMPPYQHVQEVSVGEIETTSDQLRIKTAKRLGFKFSYDED